MKMRLYHRFILVIGAMITLVIGAFLIVAACGLLPFFKLVTQEAGESFYSWQRIAIIAAGAFLVLFGGYTMLFPGKLRYNKKDFIVQKSEKGDLLFSIKTLETLVRECVDMHKEIEVKSLHIHPGKEGIAVRLRVIMASNISMPLVQDSLANQIKQYVTASSGVQVSSVNVAVVGVAGKAGGQSSPYTVTSEETAAPEKTEAEAPREEKKLPHLRLFDKEENEAVVPVAEEAAKAAENAVSEVKEAAADAAQAVQENVENAAEQAAAAAEQAAEEVHSAAEEIGDSLNAAADEAADAAASAVEEAKKALEGTEEGHV